MSEIKVNSIKGVGASAAAITVDNTSGSASANLTAVNSVVMPNGGFLSNRNLVINGAMQVAQRGASSSSLGYQTVDRIQSTGTGFDETPSQSQSDVASGTTPYTLGFRKAFKVTNGNQTSGAGAADELGIRYSFEAQNVANSGWNFTSASSFITLSFWVKSSVAQNFYGYLSSMDGTIQRYAFETGALSADTWTKVTKTIPGNSNIQIDNNNGEGFRIEWRVFAGTNFTDSGVSLNTWAAFASGTRTPDSPTTWYTTNDATFELTGVQLEVGSVATDFEHRSFAQELELCKRYFQLIGESGKFSGHVAYYRNTSVEMQVAFFPQMRTIPTFTATSGSNYYYFYRQTTFDVFNAWTDLGAMGKKGGAVYSSESDVSVTDTGIAGAIYFNTGGQLFFNAEL